MNVICEKNSTLDLIAARRLLILALWNEVKKRNKQFHFEHWQAGQMVQVLTVSAVSDSKAVDKLSEQYKGVFRLQHQT